jgi:signal peptidase II
VNRRNIIFAVVALLGFVTDQASKAWIVATIPDAGSRGITIIPGFFDLVHARNPGAAFGLLRDFEYRHLVFVGFTFVAVGVVLDMLRKLRTDDRYMAFVLGLVMSGAVGNAVDRLRQRWVTDFLRFHIEQPALKDWMVGLVGTNEYPAFNLADTWLVVGIVMYVLHEWFFSKPPGIVDSAHATEPPASPYPPASPPSA